MNDNGLSNVFRSAAKAMGCPFNAAKFSEVLQTLAERHIQGMQGTIASIDEAEQLPSIEEIAIAPKDVKILSREEIHSIVRRKVTAAQDLQQCDMVSIDEADHAHSVLTAEDLKDFEPGILADAAATKAPQHFRCSSALTPLPEAIRTDMVSIDESEYTAQSITWQGLGEIDSDFWRNAAEALGAQFDQQRFSAVLHRLSEPLTGLEVQAALARLGMSTPVDISEMRQAYVDNANSEINRAIAEGVLGNGFTVKPTPKSPPQCHSCHNHHGKTYGGNLLVCAMHPSGYEGESCEDFEEFQWEEQEAMLMKTQRAELDTLIASQRNEREALIRKHREQRERLRAEHGR